MEIDAFKQWLGTGSINIFGLPMSGKDTVGERLAKILGARFLSSGAIIRQVETELSQNMTGDGALIPTNQFYDIVLPYFERKELEGLPLVLSSVGRWNGEETKVISVAKHSGHPIKAAIFLELPETEAKVRRATAIATGERGARADDTTEDIFNTRLAEFRSKTIPVLRHYQKLGLLITVNGAQSREAVFTEVLQRLIAFSKSN